MEKCIEKTDVRVSSKQHNLQGYLIPREHGGWSVLFIPATIGAVAAGRFNIQLLLFFISTFFFYLARHPLSVYIKKWKHGGEEKGVLLTISVIYLISGFLFFIPLLLYWKLYLLIPLGILVIISTIYYLFYIVPSSLERSWGAEIIGILTLCLSAIGSYYVCKSSIKIQSIYLFILCALYFTGPVFYVKMMIEFLKVKGKDTLELKKLKISCLTYHIICVILSFFLSLIAEIPRLFTIAFIPPLIKVILSTISKQPIPIRNLGYREVFHSILFLIIASLSLIYQNRYD